MRTRLPGLSGSSWLFLILRPDQHRYNGAGIQTKLAMSQNTQNRRNLTRMTGNRHKQVFFPAKKRRRRRIKGIPDLVERTHRTRILAGAALVRDPVPQLVALGKVRLEPVLGPSSVNSRLVSAAIARMNRNTLAQTLENQRCGFVAVQKTVEGRVKSLQAARQRAHKVRVWRVDALDC